MKKINKRLMVILLSGFVLVTGCNNKIENNKTNTSKKIENDVPVETSNEEQIIKETTKEPTKTVETTPTVTPDEQIKTYVNEINNSIDKEEIKEKVIKTFITLTDFIFYDGEIKGIKFNDLKEETKKEILDIYTIIDKKIENKFPDYKNDLSQKYDITTNYIKNKYVEISNNVKDKIKEKIGEDTYNSIEETNKEIIEQDKKNLKVIKEKAEETTDKAKTKVKNWYDNLKNKQ